VYIEGGKTGVVRVEHVEIFDTGIRAILVPDPSAPLVYFSREKPPRFAEGETAFPERWVIFNRNWRFFERDWLDPVEPHWHGLPHMGWHVFFAEDVIQRFLERDLGWMSHYLPVGSRHVHDRGHT
jgi:hypothetical protein